jgi:hypothetical protein
MAAPEGNEFWKLRSKHGRDKLFESPKLLWESACEYFEWCDNNPLKEMKVFHTNGLVTKTDVTKMRAYTIDGFLLYVKASDSYLRAFKSSHKDKTDKESKDFLTVIREIEKTIYIQKFTGAAADLLNPNIIARDLGLSDKQDINMSGDVNIEPKKFIK